MQGAYIWRGDLTEGFLCYEFGGLYLEGLIHGGAYFENFTVFDRTIGTIIITITKFSNLIGYQLP